MAVNYVRGAIGSFGALSLPPALALTLIIIGITTGYLFITNLTIVTMALACIVAFLFKLFHRNLTAAIAAVISFILVSLSWSYERQIREYYYDTVILVEGERYQSRCIPTEGITIVQSLVQICARYDFNTAGFVDAIVRIDPPEDEILTDIYWGYVPERVEDDLARFGYIWPHRFTARKLRGKYYLVHDWFGGITSGEQPLNCNPFCGQH